MKETWSVPKSIKIRGKIAECWVKEFLVVEDIEDRQYVVDHSGQLYRLTKLKQKVSWK